MTKTFPQLSNIPLVYLRIHNTTNILYTTQNVSSSLPSHVSSNSSTIPERPLVHPKMWTSSRPRLSRRKRPIHSHRHDHVHRSRYPSTNLGNPTTAATPSRYNATMSIQYPPSNPDVSLPHSHRHLLMVPD